MMISIFSFDFDFILFNYSYNAFLIEILAQRMVISVPEWTGMMFCQS